MFGKKIFSVGIISSALLPIVATVACGDKDPLAKVGDLNSTFTAKTLQSKISLLKVDDVVSPAELGIDLAAGNLPQDYQVKLKLKEPGSSYTSGPLALTVVLTKDQAEEQRAIVVHPETGLTVDLTKGQGLRIKQQVKQLGIEELLLLEIQNTGELKDGEIFLHLDFRGPLDSSHPPEYSAWLKIIFKQNLLWQDKLNGQIGLHGQVFDRFPEEGIDLPDTPSQGVGIEIFSWDLLNTIFSDQTPRDQLLLGDQGLLQDNVLVTEQAPYEFVFANANPGQDLIGYNGAKKPYNQSKIIFPANSKLLTDILHPGLTTLNINSIKPYLANIEKSIRYELTNHPEKYAADFATFVNKEKQLQAQPEPESQIHLATYPSQVGGADDHIELSIDNLLEHEVIKLLRNFHPTEVKEGQNLTDEEKIVLSLIKIAKTNYPF